jgi:hypothetical protein
MLLYASLCYNIENIKKKLFASVTLPLSNEAVKTDISGMRVGLYCLNSTKTVLRRTTHGQNIN